MERATLGSTGVELTRLSLGCAPIGGLFEVVGDDGAAATVEAAWEAGIRAFDVAPLYGHGLAERRLGAALAGHRRSEAVVSTKVGRLLVPRDGPPPDQWPEAPALAPVFDFSADGVRRSLEASLERLGTHYVDIALIHDPDDHMEVALRETVPALVRLRDEGVVRAIGAGMNQAPALARFVREAPIDCVLVAGRYSLLDQSAGAELLPACLEHGVSVIAGGVFNSGVLASPEPGAHYDYRPVPEELLARARRLGAICSGHGVPLPAAALAFPLRHPAITSVLVGARSPAEVRADVELAATTVPGQLWDELVAEGLLDASRVGSA